MVPVMLITEKPPAAQLYRVSAQWWWDLFWLSDKITWEAGWYVKVEKPVMKCFIHDNR